MRLIRDVTETGHIEYAQAWTEYQADGLSIRRESSIVQRRYVIASIKPDGSAESSAERKDRHQRYWRERSAGWAAAYDAWRDWKETRFEST